MTRTLLLVGTRKGAFILDGDGDRDDVVGPSEPLCEGWPIHDLQWDPATGSIYAGGGSPWYGPAVFRSDDLGETWTHSSEGLTYGDDGPKIPTVWNVTPAHGSIYAGVEPAGLFRSDDGGATWRTSSGLRDHPSRAGLAAGRGRPDLPHDRPPPDRRREDVGRDQRGRDVRDRGRRRDVGGAQPRRRRLQLAGPAPGDRPVRPQARDGGRRARQPLPAEPLRRLPLDATAAARWEDVSKGLSSEFGFVMGTHPRDPDTALGDPAEPSRGGPARARRRARGLADARPRRQLGAPRRRACPRRTPSSASYARRCRSTGSIRSASSSGRAPGQLYGSTRRGRQLARGSPTTCRRSGASRPSRSTEPRSMATVILPRSLVVADPGHERARPRSRRRPSPRRSTGSTSGRRACATGSSTAGPRSAEHINVFVDGEPGVARHAGPRRIRRST